MITTREIDPAESHVRKLIDALDEYQLRLYPEESNHLDPVADLTNPNVYFVGAFDDGELLGIGAIKFLFGDCEYGEIKRVYVCQSGRGMGVSKIIMHELERCAAKKGLNIIRLETGIHQPEAIGLYERLGYVRCGQYGEYPDDPLSVFMEKTLK